VPFFEILESQCSWRSEKGQGQIYPSTLSESVKRKKFESMPFYSQDDSFLTPQSKFSKKVRIAQGTE
jgi:hypothetical protein